MRCPGESKAFCKLVQLNKTVKHNEIQTINRNQDVKYVLTQQELRHFSFYYHQEIIINLRVIFPIYP